jgi:hypothetical protein
VPYPWWDLKLVYKPADLEVDCLLVGDSAAVNRVVYPAQFMQQSLTEIFNARVAMLKDSTIEPLPTYRILPRNPTSSQTPPPIRGAYGYIQHLGYDLSGTSVTAKGYYPLGYSDYLIFPNQPQGPIVTKFYRQLGEWTALSTTFSLTDLHIENVRAYRYQPHLIDLEISLTAPMNTVEDTDLFIMLENSPIGGINGELLAGPNYWNMAVSQGRINSTQSVRGKRRTLENRLQRPGKQIVPIDQGHLIQGFENGMGVLRACEEAGDFTTWFNRLNHVLVRLIPYATSDWTEARQRIYELAPQAGPGTQLAPTINETLLIKFSEGWGAYQDQQTPQPDFIVMDPTVVPGATGDLTGFDIPTFYHQIATTDILDSNGNALAVPANVMVQLDNPPPVQMAANINPQIYFRRPPTTDVVQNGQVADLGNDFFYQRVDDLVKEIRKALNPQQMAQSLNAIISDK